jgi:hypothetical protein
MEAGYLQQQQKLNPLLKSTWFNLTLLSRSGGPFDAFLDCDKIFGSSNDRLIEIAQLPYIFLEHPTVKVEVLYYI